MLRFSCRTVTSEGIKILNPACSLTYIIDLSISALICFKGQKMSMCVNYAHDTDVHSTLFSNLSKLCSVLQASICYHLNMTEYKTNGFNNTK